MMPVSPPLPPHVMAVRPGRVRSGSALPTRPSSKLGKRSSPPRDVVSTPPNCDARVHKALAPLRSSSAQATSRLTTAEKQSESASAGGLTAGAAIEAAHKRYRSASQNTFNRASQGQSRDPLIRRAVLGIPLPSSHIERPLQHPASLSSTSSQPGALAFSSSGTSSSGAAQAQGVDCAASTKTQQTHLRRPSLQPLILHRQATVRSASSNIQPPSKPEFTFTSRLSVQPSRASTTSDSLPGLRSSSAVELPTTRLGSTMFSSSDKVKIDQTPSKREAYASGKTERIPAAAAASAKRKVLDTPAVRERGYRRLGNLMLLPGRHSMSNSGADFVGHHDVGPRYPAQSAEQGDSRSSTPTQKDFGDRLPSQCLSSTSPSTSSNAYPSSVKQRVEQPSRALPMPDQTCVTLAVLGVNEDTFLVSDDAILADLCAEASRVEFVAERKLKEPDPVRQSARHCCCCPVRSPEGTHQQDASTASKASELLFVSKPDSDTHLAMLELQEKVDELTRALQQERFSHAEDTTQLKAANLKAVEEARKSQEQVDNLVAGERREREEVKVAQQAQIKELQRTAGRALVGGAVAGYEGLLKAVAVELDLAKSEREVCALLLRNLQRCSSAVL